MRQAWPGCWPRWVGAYTECQTRDKRSCVIEPLRSHLASPVLARKPDDVPKTINPGYRRLFSVTQHNPACNPDSAETPRYHCPTWQQKPAGVLFSRYAVDSATVSYRESLAPYLRVQPGAPRAGPRP